MPTFEQSPCKFTKMATSSSTGAKSIVRKVKPLLSLDKQECRRRVINLYKAWYRHIPNVAADYEIPVRVPDMREKLKEEFMKNKHIQDIRVIDMLVIKGEMELREIAENFKQMNHIMYFFKDSVPKKPQDFLSKFIDGRD